MPTGDASPFARLPGTHAATFSEIAHESRAAAKDGHGSGLLFTIYGDAPSAAQLDRLVAVLPEMSSIWRHCADSPDDAKHLLPYLESHRLRRTTTFSAYGFATVPQIRDALARRERLLSLLIGVTSGRQRDPSLRELVLKSL
jgi:hypothetical protein